LAREGAYRFGADRRQKVPTAMTETPLQPMIEAPHKGRAALEADPHLRVLSLTQGRIG